MAGELPHGLHVAGHRLVTVVDAERQGCVRRSRPVTGSRNQSGSTTSGRGVPSTSQSPASRRSATGRCSARHAPTSSTPTGSVTRSRARGPRTPPWPSASTTATSRSRANVKSVWELSRHHHLTVLAAAWWLTGTTATPMSCGPAALVVGREPVPVRHPLDQRDRARGAADELGVDPSAARRLAGGRRPLRRQPTGPRQLRWHQEHLAAFRSRGSSANNHAIAESVGRLAAACALPWFAESEGWRRDADPRPGARARRQHLPQRHQPRARHRLPPFRHRARAGRPRRGRGRGTPAGRRDPVTRALRSTPPPPSSTPAGRAPRQGDGDEGRALVLDDPGDDPVGGPAGLRREHPGRLRRGGHPVSPGVMSTLLGALAPASPVTDRPQVAPWAFADAGLHVLAHVTGRRARDLVPLRRRPPRLPLDRGARARRRPVDRGPARRRRPPGRPGPSATTASPSGGATSAPRARTTPSRSTARTRPARPARSCGPSTRTPSSTASTRAPTGASSGRPTTRRTRASTRRSATTARSCSTAPCRGSPSPTP